MGTWGLGAFDNDAALDWLGDVQDTPMDERRELVEDTLAEVTDATDYIDVDDMCAAVAAAALVAIVRNPSLLETESYAPDEWFDPAEHAFLADLAPLAREAVDRAFSADENEWFELWQEAARLDEVHGALAPIRTALAT